MITAEYYTQLKTRLKDTVSPDNIFIVEGTVPVLISVPHAVPHIRDGRQKSDEVNTDVIGMILQEHAGCHLFVNAGVEGDPNHDESNIYKDKLAEYVKTHDVAFVIDIHGASAERDFDFEFGTAYGRNIEGLAECEAPLVSLVSLYGWKATVNEYFPADGANRVSSFVKSHTGIPSIQIEINRNRRGSYDSVCATAAMLHRYVKGILDLLKLPSKEGHKLLWVCRSDRFMPRNLVCLPQEFKGDFGMNDNVDLLFQSGSEEFVVKGFSVPDGCVGLTGQMISRYACEDGHLILAVRPYTVHNVHKPQAEDIDNVYALLSEDLYEKYKDFDLLEVLNPFDNLRSYFKVKKYEGNVNARTDSVWLSYYQRKLLGIEVPHTLSHNYMLRFLARLNEDDAAFFKAQYQYDEEQDTHVRVSGNADSASRLRSIWGSVFGKVRFRGVSAVAAQRQGVVLERLVGKKPLQLRAARCLDTNEVMDAVFVTKNSSIVLGVSELDYVWLTHENKRIRAKVVLIEQDDYRRIVQANGLKSDEELDLLVCIPAKIRLGLGVYEPGTSVQLERSVKDLFVKNAFAQMMTLLGLFIAIMSLPDIMMLHKALIFLLLSPVIVYSVLAEERNKI